tara:strand:- start:104 stop:895 length:792 start_codon:yes stop_codon:yes gene_type:complete
MCDSYNIEPIGYESSTRNERFLVTPGSKRNLETLADIIEFNMASYFERLPKSFRFFEFSDWERMSLSNDHRDRLVYGIIMTTIEYRKNNENLLILAEMMKDDDRGAKIYETILNRNNSAKVLFEDSYTFIRPDENPNINITPVNTDENFITVRTYVSAGIEPTISYHPPAYYHNEISGINNAIESGKSSKYKIMAKLKSKLPRDSKEENDEYACIICADKKKLVVLLPCEHINHCVECAIASIGVDNTCPVCRETVEDVVVTF